MGPLSDPIPSSLMSLDDSTLTTGSGMGVEKASRQSTAPGLSALKRTIMRLSVKEAKASSVNVTPPALYVARVTALSMSRTRS